MGWHLTIQCIIERSGIRKAMKSVNLEWEYDPFNRWDEEWKLNLTRLVDAVEQWCKDSGIKSYGVGFTQIALNATFLEGRDAMMFKLRWHFA